MCPVKYTAYGKGSQKITKPVQFSTEHKFWESNNYVSSHKGLQLHHSLNQAVQYNVCLIYGTTKYNTDLQILQMRLLKRAYTITHNTQ
jgi:hypothetical protein